MQIPVVEKFFCCVELRRACIGIGWGYGILLSISFVAYLLSLIGNNGQAGSAIASSLISLISVGFCVILVLGVKRERASFVRLGMYFLIVHSVLLVITSLINLLSIGLIVLFVYLPLSIYCVITVRSYYLVMTGAATSPTTGA